MDKQQDAKGGIRFQKTQLEQIVEANTVLKQKLVMK